MDLLASFFRTDGFLPHGQCLAWTAALLWTTVGADAVIAAALFSLPLAFLGAVRKRDGLPIPRIAWLFGALVVSIGVTELVDIWTLWQPVYGLLTLTKTVTAVITLATVAALWPWLPRLLTLLSAPRPPLVGDTLDAEISRRQEVDKQVIDVEQHLAVMLATIGAGYISTDREGRVKRMNTVAEALTGWRDADARGQDYWNVFVREGRPADHRATNAVDVLVRGNVTLDTVHRVVAVSRSGVRTSVDVQAAATRAPDGSVVGAAILFRDAMRLVKAEAESNRLAAIVESSHDAIIGKTLEGRITNWNRGAEALFGYTAEEAIGQPVQMLIPPEYADEEMRILNELSHGERVPAFHTVRRHRDGTLMDVSVTISPIHDGEGRIIGGAKIARDISPQRRMERALRDSNARLRFTLDAAQIGDWDLDLATGAVKRSLRHDRCFGYEQMQADWNFTRFIQHVHPDDRAEVERTFNEAVRDLEHWRCQCRVIWPDGSIHWISAHGIVPQSNGEATHMLGIVTEITVQREADEARLQAQRLEAENQQIQEANRLKSQFLANMSHELRTPLNAIIGFSDLLQSGAVEAGSAQQQSFLGHIGTSGRHLLQLINDVLDLSKVESGKFDFHIEPVELPQIVAEAKNVLHTMMLRKRIRLTTEIDPTLTGLVLDGSRLKQVLYNYLSNAIKFTAEGGQVMLRARPEGAERFRIEVEDTGIGIATSDLPRLFTEFRQLDTGYSKQHQGTGLGLALTRRLVEAQGGSVGVRSVPGVGSVFHLVLDRVQRDPLTVAGSPAHPFVAVDEPALPNRILLIGGVPGDQAVLPRALAQSGFQVSTADTGAAAVEQASRTAYDALTLNLVLPDQHGLEALARIRRQGASHAARVSGLSMPALNPNASPDPSADTTASTATHPDAHANVASFAITDLLWKPLHSDDVLRAMSRFNWPERQPAKVMVIDDDPVALDLMGAMLQGMGVEAVCMTDAREALRGLDRHCPDAVILDLMMPGMNGFEALHELRGLPHGRDLPVFIWTSMLLTDQEYATLAGSASAILGKGGGTAADMLAALRRAKAMGPATASEAAP